MGKSKKNNLVKIDVKKEWCKGCGICVAFCPKNVLAINEEGKVYVKDPEQCAGCGNCTMYCPDFAISTGRPENEETKRKANAG